jgi:hypothetical protein
MKCECSSVALRIALDDMTSRTWLQCCKEAVKRVNQWEGHEHIKTEKRYESGITISEEAMNASEIQMHANATESPRYLQC